MTRQSSKSTLFLLELVFAIMFFAISSAFCVQIFVKAHFLTAESKNINMAINFTQNISTCLKNNNGSTQYLESFLGTEINEETTVYLNNDFAITNEENYKYILEITKSDSFLVTIKISDCKNNNILTQDIYTHKQLIRKGDKLD
ncbi:MAG: hypothetical protein RR806_00880 [Oscillospiraceae bacterium]